MKTTGVRLDIEPAHARVAQRPHSGLSSQVERSFCDAISRANSPISLDMSWPGC